LEGILSGIILTYLIYAPKYVNVELKTIPRSYKEIPHVLSS
jgi:hypothetical protein